MWVEAHIKIVFEKKETNIRLSDFKSLLTSTTDI